MYKGKKKLKRKKTNAKRMKTEIETKKNDERRENQRKLRQKSDNPDKETQRKKLSRQLRYYADPVVPRQ